MTYFQLLSSIFFPFFRMRPTPPADNIRHEKKCVQEHIGIKLNLVKQKKEEDGVDYPDRPVEDVAFCGQDNENQTGKGPEEFQIAHPVTPDHKEDVVDVEEFQIVFVLGSRD